MIWHIISWSLLSLLPLSSLAAQESYPIRTISVTGTAVVKTTPDVIIWRIQLVNDGADLHKAKRSNDTKTERLFDLRGELDIADGDLETGHVNVRRVYKRDQKGNRTEEFDYFRVRRSIMIRQRDLKRFDEFLERFVATSEMEVNFDFRSTRESELRNETRIMALQVAKEKAQKMAEVVDAKCGKVITIDEHPPSGRVRNLGYNAMHIDSRREPITDVASGTSAPGDIEVKVTVYVTFELRRP